MYDADLALVQAEVVMTFDDWVRTLPRENAEIVTGGFPVPAVAYSSTGHLESPGRRGCWHRLPTISVGTRPGSGRD